MWGGLNQKSVDNNQTLDIHLSNERNPTYLRAWVSYHTRQVNHNMKILFDEFDWERIDNNQTRDFYIRELCTRLIFFFYHWVIPISFFLEYVYKNGFSKKMCIKMVIYDKDISTNINEHLSCLAHH